MNPTELRAKSVAELHTLLIEKRVELGNNQRSLAAGELPNPRVVGKVRRDIARILTCLSEAQLTETSSLSSDKAKEGEA